MQSGVWSSDKTSYQDSINSLSIIVKYSASPIYEPTEGFLIRLDCLVNFWADNARHLQKALQQVDWRPSEWTPSTVLILLEVFLINQFQQKPNT
jgi:hypothetical protein